LHCIRAAANNASIVQDVFPPEHKDAENPSRNSAF
jgi:hypothetical protein